MVFSSLYAGMMTDNEVDGGKAGNVLFLNFRDGEIIPEFKRCAKNNEPAAGRFPAAGSLFP
jgi:hypothetical protein